MLTVAYFQTCFELNIPNTIRPSPEPKSKTLPVLPFKADKMLIICSVVAGTYGKQNLRKAGLMKGVQITVIPIAIPPKNFENVF